MPQVILIQPNGKFANFSSIVDDFTLWDFNEDELRDYLVGQHGKVQSDAIDRSIEKAKEDALSWISEEPREDGLGRWFGALQTILVLHGKKRFDAAVKETAGDAAYPAEELAALTLQWQAEAEADRAADALLDS